MTNVYLKVDFAEKDQVKLLGGRWDNDVKKWYIPSGLDLNNFSKWLLFTEQPKNGGFAIDNYKDKGITLSQLLHKVNQTISQITPHLEWIKAEISEVSLHTMTRHCYLELVEMQNGQLLSKAKAMIVKDDYPILFERFKQVTGDFLKPGMQVLLLVKLNFSVQYGFSLYIKDLDPAYTIGDLAAKLAKIRDTLQQEGIYSKNKQLKMPGDFTRVAVLSPNAAAGLGDFKREAALLQNYGLCDFYYYTSQFQGTDAINEITSALGAIFIADQTMNFDAIVIIRGGGAAVDLAWLNDYSIAKLICESQIVVFAGIGHERDNTIIDEVAGRKFDTPSKVIGHIFNTIVHNAQQAAIDAKEIDNLSKNIYLSNYNITAEQLNKILKIAELGIVQIRQNVEQQYNNTLINSKNTVKISTTLITQQYARLYEHHMLQLTHIQAKALEYFKNINIGLPKIYLVTKQELPLLWRNIETFIDQNYRSSNEIVARIFNELTGQAINQYHQKVQIIQQLMTNIISLGPQATLKRGYVVVRDPLNQLISSKTQAKNYRDLQIEFYDGILKIIHNGEA